MRKVLRQCSFAVPFGSDLKESDLKEIGKLKISRAIVILVSALNLHLLKNPDSKPLFGLEVELDEDDKSWVLYLSYDEGWEFATPMLVHSFLSRLSDLEISAFLLIGEAENRVSCVEATSEK